MKYSILALALLTSTAFAQAPVTPVTDTLNSSEELALKYISQEFQQAQQDLARLQNDVKKAHPGYSLNINTGTLVKDEVKPAPAPAPDPAPVPKK